VVRRCVWSRKPREWGGHDPRWIAAPQKKKDLYIWGSTFSAFLPKSLCSKVWGIRLQIYSCSL